MAKVENRYAPERQGEPHFCMREIKSLVQDAVAVPAPEPTDQQQAGHYLNAITRTTAVTLKLKRYSGTPPHPEGNSSAAFGFIWGFFRVGCCLVVAANRPPAPAQPLLQQLG